MECHGGHKDGRRKDSFGKRQSHQMAAEIECKVEQSGSHIIDYKGVDLDCILRCHGHDRDVKDVLNE
jgi:hypothetical protein